MSFLRYFNHPMNVFAEFFLIWYLFCSQQISIGHEWQGWRKMIKPIDNNAEKSHKSTIILTTIYISHIDTPNVFLVIRRMLWYLMSYHTNFPEINLSNIPKKHYWCINFLQSFSSQSFEGRVLDSTFNISPCPEITIMYDIIGNTLMNAMYVRISLNSNSH